ncbi:Calcium-activated potassium channel subunit beta-4 BK channel subunit beta-4 [Larimichthys crocea]|uniref:Calcium-activated potassium channel subunit beta-4 BK channel subunit beta-4 n=1 Tax=Larimichthys crocea TaxID=215358 RepID=A0A6G0HPH6_LARCR|nr:Calcium-activated potassium channel subunit beta-4 BK channel subunit beta-4 [Larimichthys crocea]
MAKMRVSYEYSEAEDKSIRLGLFLIACGILSLFILGFCWLSPTLQSLQSKPANCTVSPDPSSERRPEASCSEPPLGARYSACSCSHAIQLLPEHPSIYSGREEESQGNPARPSPARPGLAQPGPSTLNSRQADTAENKQLAHWVSSLSADTEL